MSKDNIISKKRLDSFIKFVKEDISTSKRKLKYEVMNEIMERQIALSRVITLKGLLEAEKMTSREILEVIRKTTNENYHIYTSN